jgi:cytochrome c-type biogenesis protein CcmF
MANTAFAGEHLLPGQLGHAFVILSFVSALLATLAYAFYKREKPLDADNKRWLQLGRWAFRVHSLSVLGIGITLFSIILNHQFEYFYAWSHSSKALPKKYIISCFWEGQEGSFLLWTFWNAVLGNILIRIAKGWEAPVIAVTSAAQVMLSSMLLGIFVLGYKVGSSPFVLLRNAMPEAPFLQTPNYLASITDGNGLNPLLQNYWMVIHPPVLFLGFASTVVPFAYACAAMLRRNYREWIGPALPWALFSVAILGTGIMMGGAWAYESLSFGGYWAWDPVENASLIPWLTMIAGVHVLMPNTIANHRVPLQGNQLHILCFLQCKCNLGGHLIQGI